MAIFVDPIIWGLLYVFIGISMSGMFMVIESWLNDRTENEFRGRVFPSMRLSCLLPLLWASNCWV
jgi:hypothetical protein